MEHKQKFYEHPLTHFHCARNLVTHRRVEQLKQEFVPTTP